MGALRASPFPLQGEGIKVQHHAPAQHSGHIVVYTWRCCRHSASVTASHVSAGWARSRRCHQQHQGESPACWALLPDPLYGNRTAEQDNTSHLKENISSSINYFPCYSWRWPSLKRKKNPIAFISFIQLPILKPLARMSHIYICYHITLCSINAATCLLFLTTQACCH